MALVFDYVIVGAGSAGCVLASRLSEEPDVSVLLIEDGSRDVRREVCTPPAWPTLVGSDLDYGYRTIPQQEMYEARVVWPRGRAVGGCSAINAMVYLRGHRDDYDTWARQGATGWAFHEVLPYFRRMESVPSGDPRFRGTTGPMRPGPAHDPNPLSAVFLVAAAAVGHPMTPDFNGEHQVGAGWQDLSISGGQRQSVADAYLTPSVLGRSNLTVHTESRALTLIVRGGRCKGVRVGRAGAIIDVLATREVVVSCGAIDSPRLLLLSGIGPADELGDAGVRVVQDLPGVGRNLHDHPLTSVVYEASREIPPGASNLSEASLLWRSDDALPGPDLQMQFVHVPFLQPGMQAPPNSFTLGVATVPTSRGTIRLRNADPAASPLIDPRYLTEVDDRTRLVQGVEMARAIVADGAFDGWRGAELYPGGETTGADDLEQFVRRATGTYCHPVGTCAMGSGDDAVVTPDLRVRGVENLRVVDASVMPRIVSVNTNVPTIMIAERGAELIRAGVSAPAASSSRASGALTAGPRPVEHHPR
ncbi:GMC family oxidoreductase [Pseudonocardia alaniniphila]|uniref:GMC family oxidoreductase N-terminal domain-containing protein n=1 Tax=Pseudonocardia alaniniphila TaxID=75291 RepID=A0ABS9TQU6_9PSEU|nr:GMC family oxidoreductase N-terminal domain-containing protein [Pseudonocardia alaniniphila]MCH6170896.1 GMC family oxidoreductase N-terminal domain-containing protein [Pseudonocardia alaniniphila]